MLRQYFSSLTVSLLILTPTAFGQTFAHCWESSGKKIDGSEAKSFVNIMIQIGVPSYHRSNGEEWSTTVVNCQNVWVMPNYSRMHYACRVQLQDQIYSVGEASSAAIVKILESNHFPSETGGEITRWQVNGLSCGTSDWAGPSESSFTTTDFAFYPVFGGKMVKFNTVLLFDLAPPPSVTAITRADSNLV